MFCVFKVRNLKKIHPFPRFCAVLMNELNINKVTGIYAVVLLSKNFLSSNNIILFNYSRMFPSVVIPVIP